jgi:hypothetical protein
MTELVSSQASLLGAIVDGHLLSCLHIGVPLSGSTSIFSLLIVYQSYWIRAHPHDLILT